MRFLLDEHVSHAVAMGLKQRGVAVATLSQAKLLGQSDDEILAHALQEGQVVVTHDDDFLKHAARGIEHFGIVYSHQGSRSLGEIIRFLTLMANCLGEDEMRNRVEFI